MEQPPSSFSRGVSQIRETMNERPYRTYNVLFLSYANNKRAYQSALVRRLMCTFVVHYLENIFSINIYPKSSDASLPQ